MAARELDSLKQVHDKTETQLHKITSGESNQSLIVLQCVWNER